MADETYRLEVPRADREALVLCLTLGTLEAMRGGSWSLEAGIWTLVRPVFWESLAEVDAEVVKVLQSADDLDALVHLGGYPAAEAALDRMIAVVRSRLSALSGKFWYARWADEPET